ncbi:AAA ATPase [Phlyctochytrium bullatum]|nr:AAA ATPase [Phlyctochytrium bullatum]
MQLRNRKTIADRQPIVKSPPSPRMTLRSTTRGNTDVVHVVDAARPASTPKKSAPTRSTHFIFDDSNKENIDPLNPHAAILVRVMVTPARTPVPKRTFDTSADDENKADEQKRRRVATPIPATPRVTRASAKLSTTPSTSTEVSPFITPAKDTIPGLAKLTPPATPAASAPGSPAYTPVAVADPLAVYRSVKSFFKPSCTPAKLVHRQKERDALLDFFRRTAVAEKPGSLYVSGSPGTGKTALVNEVLGNLKTEFPSLAKCGVKTVYINCMELTATNDIYNKILQSLGDTAPTVGEDKYTAVVTALSADKTRRIRAMRVVVLDEIDHLISTQRETLYKLFQIPSMAGCKLVLVGIANSIDLLDKHLPNLPEECVAPERLNFCAYNATEIGDIIKARLRDAKETLGHDLAPLAPKTLPDGTPLTDFIHPSAIDLCARRVSSSGDLRRALDVCRQSFEILETEVTRKRAAGTEWMANGEMPKVAVTHMLKASATALVTGPVQRIMGLSTQQKAVLVALVLVMGKGTSMAVGDLYDAYIKFCKNKAGVTPVNNMEFKDIVSLLETSGLVEYKLAQEERDRRVVLSVLTSQVEQGLKTDPVLRDVLLASRY